MSKDPVMAAATGHLELVRFGEFDFDPRSGVLRRRGCHVNIQGQPLRVLEVLLEQAGTIVLRDELCRRLWPDDFVDFDNGLNNAVSRLRVALGDSAIAPRFIETLGRRGYRFIAPVERVDDGGAGLPARAWLIGERGRVALKNGPNILGRKGNDVVELPSSTVSRRHARITIAEEMFIEDLGSKNGTFVGEQRVTVPVRLADGDRVRIGSLVLTFRIARASEETRTRSFGP